ncbi:acetaldehyde dehydrogenase (acetylating) [Euzebya sp.]|uniref:acetaldehyde dehydrogenase (acetylating) n=1 Tax=Euzebya sp. TaxID=1971409 RepID=UPI0035179164
MRCAIVGSGNIGTDLMYKLLRSPDLELTAVVGIDPDSDGLAKAAAAGLDTSHEGADWVIDHADSLDLVIEATSAWVHRRNAPRYADAGLRVIDLTPAKLGPLVVPPVNGDAHVEATNVNLITCGGQATVPMVHAVARVVDVPYAEIVSSVSSRSAGPGTRQNIDEFTQTTSAALVAVGGAATGKAIMVLNPAEPPILMRNTVFCALPDDHDEAAVTASIVAMVAEVQGYVPGYRLKAEPVYERDRYATPGGEVGARVVILLEVEGAGDYFPPYAGNLDIMTAAAVRVGEAMARAGAGVAA